MAISAISLILLTILLHSLSLAETSPKIHKYEPNLKVNHTSLVVKWSHIDDSTFILAYGQKENIQSKLFISSSYKEPFVEIPLRYPSSEVPMADHLYLKRSRILMTDSSSKVVCSLKNFNVEKDALIKSGIPCIPVDFDPVNIIFHPDLSDDILVHDKNSKELYHSDDYGTTWKLIEQQVYSVYWEDWSGKNAIYIMRREAMGFNVLKKYFSFPTINVIDSQVEDFQMGGHFVFTSKRVIVADYSISGQYEHVTLHVSKRESPFKKAVFYGDSAFEMKAPVEYHVADVSDGQVFLVVTYYFKNTNDRNAARKGPFYHDLYLSDVTGVQYDLSLSNISYISPLSSPNVFKGRNFVEKAVDLYSVHGLRGVFIATKVLNPELSNEYNKLKFKTLITFNKGATWEDMVIPAQDESMALKIHGAAHNCIKDGTTKECAIQFVQSSMLKLAFDHLRPLYTSSAAPGMILATGQVGPFIELSNFTQNSNDVQLKRDKNYYMFLSFDGGITFSVGLKGRWIYELLDSGSIIVAVDCDVATQMLWYTFDEGENWSFFEFSEKDMLVYNLRSVKGNQKTSRLAIYASAVNPETNRAVDTFSMIYVDFADLFPRKCDETNDADYDMKWKIKSTKERRSDLCILGRLEVYKRRYPTSLCLNGESFDPDLSAVPCVCERNDYTCDLGALYVPKTGNCEWISTPPSAKTQCKSTSGQTRTFVQSKGYKKIEGDDCTAGDYALHKWEPEHRACPSPPLNQFLLMTDGKDIHRFDLADDTQTTVEQVVDVGDHRHAFSFGYSYPSNTIFYVDAEQDNSNSKRFIKSIDLSSFSAPQIIHESSAYQIHHLAVDFVNSRLYWVEAGNNYKCRVVSSDFKGKIKRTVLSDEQVGKVATMVVDPIEGFIFWMESSDLKRATLDGREVTSIVSRDIHWSESINVDFFTDDNKGWVYWIEPFNNRVERCHYDGSSCSVVLALEPNESPKIASITTFKQYLYVSDEDSRSVSRVTPNPYGSERKEDLTEVFTLRTSKGSSNNRHEMHAFSKQTHNVVSSRCAVKNGGCSHLCIQLNETSHVCLCPDGMTATKGSDGSNINETCSCPEGETLVNSFCKADTCAEGMFTCNNKVCIPLNWKCDRSDDCGDNSDEEGCTFEKCQDYEFECAFSKKCIPLMWKCDWDVDCETDVNVEDKSDEMNCHYPACKQHQFMCNNKKCIPKEWKCDHDSDCADHSDEDNCVTQINTTLSKPELAEHCNKGGFLCDQNALCIPKQWTCDGNSDCDDHSDEANCSPKCDPFFQFDCNTAPNSDAYTCIPKFLKCDGQQDCPNGADEDESMCDHFISDWKTAAPDILPTTDPTTGECSAENEIACPTVASFKQKPVLCIPSDWFCDGVKDCLDGTDELDCDLIVDQRQCANDQFLCDSYSCINLEWHCDGAFDCTDQSDEMNCDKLEPITECLGFSCFEDRTLKCLHNETRCDGFEDCSDGSDERYCLDYVDTSKNSDPNSDDAVCSKLSGSSDVCKQDSRCFMCQSGRQCIAKSRKCDYAYNCIDQSDESHTYSQCKIEQRQLCTSETFSCRTSQTECYPKHLVCDGIQHCTDGSDESQSLCAVIVSLIVTNVESTTANIEWAIGPVDISTVSSVLVKWRKDLASGRRLNWVKATVPSVTQRHYRLTGLTTFTSYEVSVYVKFQNGTSTEDVSWITQFKTSSSKASQPLDVHVSVVAMDTKESYGSVKVEWAPPRDHNGIISAYTVYYTNTRTKEKQKIVHAVSSRDSLLQTYTLEKLRTYEEYEVQVAAINEVGEGDKSDVTGTSIIKFDSVLTGYDQPKNIELLTNNVPITNKVTVTWDKVQPKNDRTAHVKYNVRVTMVDDITVHRSVDYLTGNNKFTIQNLSPGETYRVDVQTVLNEERSQFSRPVDFKTSGDKLPTAIDLKCVFANSPRYESIKLSWSLPDNSQYDVTGYGVYYGLTTQDMLSSAAYKVKTEISSSSRSSVILSNLTSGTSYIVSVRVIELDGALPRMGPLSKEIRCPLELDPGLPARKLQCVPVSELSSLNLTCTWQAPLENTLEYYNYTILGKIEGNKNFHPVAASSYTKSASIEKLVELMNPGLKYSFKIQSVNRTGYRHNDSDVFQYTVPNRSAPTICQAYRNPNTVVWQAPESNNKPDEGYVVYGLTGDKDETIYVGETDSGQTALLDVQFPQHVTHVTVAFKAYTIKGGDTWNQKNKGPLGEFSPPCFIYHSIEAVQGNSMKDIASNRLALKVLIPSVILIGALIGTIGMLIMKQRRLENMVNITANYNNRNGVSFLGGFDPDEGDDNRSEVPYGRLQANVIDDYGDDVMLVKT